MKTGRLGIGSLVLVNLGVIPDTSARQSADADVLFIPRVSECEKLGYRREEARKLRVTPEVSACQSADAGSLKLFGRSRGCTCGVCVTPRGVVHSLKSFRGEETIIEETTLPSVETTAQKILFFRSMFAPGMLQSFLGLMRIFYYGDAYPAFPIGVRWLEWLVFWFH
ncbi:hypothetical protein C8J57DRAFT_1226227 [Mycena rebaudengoi]|nr:hypothetical protein C8J57DRAFT_1226227 [Mycena rebaudengoi]